MSEEIRRYKISGILKFSDDNVICAEGLKEAKTVLKEIDLFICGGNGGASTKIEMLESTIEDLGPYEEPEQETKERAMWAFVDSLA